MSGRKESQIPGDAGNDVYQRVDIPEDLWATCDLIINLLERFCDSHDAKYRQVCLLLAKGQISHLHECGVGTKISFTQRGELCLVFEGKSLVLETENRRGSQMSPKVYVSDSDDGDPEHDPEDDTLPPLPSLI